MCAKIIDIKGAIKKCQKGSNSAAFKDIYDQFSRKMYAICMRYLQDDSKAKDALQESFVKAYLNIKLVQDINTFEGWLRRIVVNRCLDEIKKDKEVVNSWFSEPYYDKETYEIEEELDHEELKKLLMKLLAMLPKGYSTIINLIIVERYSHKECADILGIKESTSRSQLVRAKLALRKLIAEMKEEKKIITNYYEKIG